ncbi:MAG: hypothetical protein KBC38_01755 [Candidatus Pacebacteria bacterium]|nr:hypothetical protein [Candidatus Paceibacterota bacterium]MBP9840018.1 hypothetical protein [Candidatus Paceibacterota bacterium]
MLVRGAISLVLVLLAGYGFFEAAPLLRGPQLTLDAGSYANTVDGFITVAGTASHTQSLSLNGAPLLIDEEGRFQKTLLLPSGNAILTLTAGDRFGRMVAKRLEVSVP